MLLPMRCIIIFTVRPQVMHLLRAVSATRTAISHHIEAHLFGAHNECANHLL